MRNRALHDALRDFALEAAALLTEDLRSGAELELDIAEGGGGAGPVLYRYRPRVEAFLAERWNRLRALPACGRAAAELGAGSATWLRVNGLPGERAEPALRAMLERLYEDATDFAFPEERFERIYLEVEATLYRDAVRERVVAPLRGVRLERERVELGGGLSLERPQEAAADPGPSTRGSGEPPHALAPAVCALERDAPGGEPFAAAEVAARLRRLLTAMRLHGPGGVALGTAAWRRAGDGPWAAVALDPQDAHPDEPWTLAAGDEDELRELVAALERAAPSGGVAWALARFEMGRSRRSAVEALSDYLLALRALLDATGEDGGASLALRLAALCAGDGERRLVRRRIELALSLERFLMGGRGSLDERIGEAESPPELIADVESHLRALLRDVLLGYLERDLRAVADGILLEAREPAADAGLGEEAPDAPPDTSEIDAVDPERIRVSRAAHRA